MVGRMSRTSAALVVIFVLLMLTGFGNIIMFHIIGDHHDHASPSVPIAGKKSKIDILAERKKTNVAENTKVSQDVPESRKHKIMSEGHDIQHPIAGLSCKDHGGPDDESAQEMVFWSDIPSDSTLISPFYDPEKYLTFEPDIGGWNNIRMAYETLLVLAHATGRTLVLPPEKPMYLLNKGAKEHKKTFTFNDFFLLDNIAIEHPGMNIITMEEFLKRKGVTGQLKDTMTGKVVKPPSGITDWSNQKIKPLWEYLRSVGTYPDKWEPWECFAAIPASKDPKDIQELRNMFGDIVSGKYGAIPDPLKDFVDEPVPVDGETVQRMREMLAGRKNICIYDEHLQDAEVLHFKVDNTAKARMLTHFYAFIFFQDWDLWSKRFVRDHVRYIDEIMCAAARIVKAVRERARKHDASNSLGEYDSMHIRRGDFQFKETRIGADQLYKESKSYVKEGGTLYIATDERDKAFFAPIKEHYDVAYLDDFMDVLDGVNPNYYGMLDQLVASKGRVFVGTWFSTLSGYVNRMRGYSSVKNKLEGHEFGRLQSYYFAPKARKLQMTKYMAVKLPIYMREFPTSWRDIDKGIEDLN